MIPILIDYATPSVFESTRDRELVGISANGRRPVRFHGKIARQKFLLRVALRALGEVIWSDDTWRGGADLDPIITVHPDRIFFEAFSQDQSAYAALIVDPSLFETEGEVRTGTTNVDFTAWLWAALGEMRTSRETWFRIEPAGFEVKTIKAGGRFQKKVDLPLSWVRGFLNLQGAMAIPGTRLTVRAVDLLAAARFLRYTKARVSPRAVRYEFNPGEDARIVLEPWEEIIPLKGAGHNYAEPRVIRTWGRRRLRLIEPLLPFAEKVDIYLKGRALPHFYSVQLGGITFVLGLSGWSANAWTESGSFGLLSSLGREDESQLKKALEFIRARHSAAADEIAAALGVDRAASAQIMARLCRQGRAIYDIERRNFRHRELFEEPPDEALLFPPNRRDELANDLIEDGRVKIESSAPRETRKIKNLRNPRTGEREPREIIYRDWGITGAAGEQGRVEIVIGDTGQIIFGTCGCDFFKDNMLNQGPCEHMVALHRVGEAALRDLPVSSNVDSSVAEARPPARHRDDAGDEDSVEDVDNDSNEEEE